MGARRQGALAPQLPRATRSSEFPSEHLFGFMDLGWSINCFILLFQLITLVTIVRLFTTKNIIFQIDVGLKRKCCRTAEACERRE